MKPFTTLTGTVVPLDRANVDTDQIIPKQFLKSIRRVGFGENLFDAWRFLDEGAMGQTPNERQINRNFVLNQSRYQGASILVARANFGCGSSREHAVWALEEYGIRCVLAPSFADIFFNNCFKNGVLPIVLEEEVIERTVSTDREHSRLLADHRFAEPDGGPSGRGAAALPRGTSSQTLHGAWARRYRLDAAGRVRDPGVRGEPSRAAPVAV